MNDYPLFEDDLDEEGFIQAASFHDAHPEISPVAVLCFFHELLEGMAERGELRQIYTLRSEIGNNPVYLAETDSGPVTVLHPGVGAPLAAGFMEEARALGVHTFVAVGGGGALEPLDVGHAMVVSSALRDEGTSLHYAPPSRVIEADPRGVDVLSAVLTEAELPFTIGRTWTTDAMLRETPSRIARRRAEQCVMVDMESSAFMAVARYYGFPFAQLLYAGDDLTSEKWNSRTWHTRTGIREQLFWIAATAAWRLEALA